MGEGIKRDTYLFAPNLKAKDPGPRRAKYVSCNPAVINCLKNEGYIVWTPGEGFITPSGITSMNFPFADVDVDLEMYEQVPDRTRKNLAWYKDLPRKIIDDVDLRWYKEPNRGEGVEV